MAALRNAGGGGGQRGVSDCDLSLEAGSYVAHARKLAAAGVPLARSYLNIG